MARVRDTRTTRAGSHAEVIHQAGAREHVCGPQKHKLKGTNRDRAGYDAWQPSGSGLREPART
eukprot:6651248-Prymnesium_polylepis.1